MLGQVEAEGQARFKGALRYSLKEEMTRVQLCERSVRQHGSACSKLMAQTGFFHSGGERLHVTHSYQPR
jgi:hypothetical protein